MNFQCDKIKRLLEPFLNGDLRKKERFTVKTHLKVCQSCRTDLEKDRHVVEALTSLPKLECPDNVTDTIYKVTLFRKKKAVLFRDRKFFVKPLGLRMAVVGVAVLSLVLAFYSLLDRKEPPQVLYSQTEVAKARAQAKWSLIYVTQVIKKSQRQVVDDVLMKDLPETLRNVIKNTVPIFGGDQQ